MERVSIVVIRSGIATQAFFVLRIFACPSVKKPTTVDREEYAWNLDKGSKDEHVRLRRVIATKNVETMSFALTIAVRLNVDYRKMSVWTMSIATSTIGSERPAKKDTSACLFKAPG